MNKAFRFIKNNGLTMSIGMFSRITIRNYVQRKRIKNKNVSIISQNCIGCVMAHDLGLGFNSPMVNLYIKWPDYATFLENLEYCCKEELTFVASEKKYPKAMLFGPKGEKISLYFPHDDDEIKINNDWNRRKKRINYNNIVVIATDRDGLDEECVKRFSRLPYKKILLSHSPIEKDFVHYYPRFCHMDQLPSMVEIHSLIGKRDYEFGWNYIEWLNS